MDAPLRATQRIRRRLLLSTCLQPVYLPARALLATLAPSWRGPRARAWLWPPPHGMASTRRLFLGALTRDAGHAEAAHQHRPTPVRLCLRSLS